LEALFATTTSSVTMVGSKLLPVTASGSKFFDAIFEDLPEIEGRLRQGHISRMHGGQGASIWRYGHV
jgi:ribosomal protein L35AE/L33A